MNLGFLDINLFPFSEIETDWKLKRTEGAALTKSLILCRLKTTV